MGFGIVSTDSDLENGQPSAQPAGILAGIKVVEFAQNAAIPHCGRLMAGMGAEVVKVEPTGGDAMRALAQLAPNESKAFAVINPGKRGMCLDLDHENSREVIHALFLWADVILVAFKQSDLPRYGIDWDSARQVNPRLIHLTHTPFGPKGPDADLGGYDVLVQGRSGAGFLMNRSENGAPISTRPAVNDFGTGIVSALGVVAALRHRDLTDQGQRVDTSLLGTAMTLATPMVNRFEVDEEPIAELSIDMAAMRGAGVDFDTQRAMYDDRVLPGAGAFRIYFRHYLTADGLISVAGLSVALHDKFHAATGLPRPDIRDPHTPEFDQIVEQAEALFKERTTSEWLAALRSAGFPASIYNLPYEAIDDPQIRANDFIVDIEHPAFGTYSTTGMPLQFEAAPNAIAGRSPTLGEHTAEVLSEIGLDDAAIERLAASGVVGRIA